MVAEASTLNPCSGIGFPWAAVLQDNLLWHRLTWVAAPSLRGLPWAGVWVSASPWSTSFSSEPAVPSALPHSFCSLLFCLSAIFYSFFHRFSQRCHCLGCRAQLCPVGGSVWYRAAPATPLRGHHYRPLPLIPRHIHPMYAHIWFFKYIWFYTSVFPNHIAGQYICIVRDSGKWLLFN